MSIREANLAKGARRCLKCGKVMWTDRCHRICVACSHSNEGLAEDRALIADELRPWVRSVLRSEPAGDAPRPFGLAAAWAEG